jgi:hypothetical protein
MRVRHVMVAGLLILGITSGAIATECDPSDPDLLPPDLVAQPPTKVRVLQSYNNRRIIFTTTVGNVGKGPLILSGKTVQTPSGPVTQATQTVWRKDGTTCDHLAGYFEFHASHHHWHVNDFAAYELRKDDPFTGPVVAKSDKVSFCLIDITQLRGFRGQRQVFADCLKQESVQGISVGFADVYDSFLPDQWINVDQDGPNTVPAGEYFLVNVADPDNLILETDDDPQDSSGVVSVAVPPLIASGPPAPTPGPRQHPAHPTHPPHPSRPPRPTRTPRPGPIHPAHPTH